MANDCCDECKLDPIVEGFSVLSCGRHVKPYTVTKNGVLKAVETWQITIPLHDNQNKPYPDKLINEIREDVFKNFNADTEVKTVGRWKQNQRICKDKNIRIEVDVCTKEHDRAESYMAKAKRKLKSDLKQDSIYVTVSHARFELLSLEEFANDIGLTIELLEDHNQIVGDQCTTVVATS